MMQSSSLFHSGKFFSSSFFTEVGFGNLGKNTGASSFRAFITNLFISFIKSIHNLKFLSYCKVRTSKNIWNYETNEKFTKAIDTQEMKTTLKMSNAQVNEQHVYSFNLANMKSSRFGNLLASIWLLRLKGSWVVLEEN